MGVDFHYPTGSTPLDPEEAEGLIPAHITTQGQLNEWEFTNIVEGQKWAFNPRRRTHADLISVDFMQALHKRMFDQTWKWAGTFRKTEKNIGVAPEHIATRLRDLCEDIRTQIEYGTWPPDEQRWPLFVPTAVRGATLGVIGYGSIGRELARIAKTAFAMRVLACKRDPSRRADPGYCPAGTGDPEGALPDAWFAPEQLPDLLTKSDVVVMCAPLTPETHQMIGARELGAMKPTAYFINVGRGASVDERALAAALAEKRIAGAAVDVFVQEPPAKGHPLYAIDNVILSPHVSGFVASYDDDCCTLFAENLQRYLDGAPLLNLVDRAQGY